MPWSLHLLVLHGAGGWERGGNRVCLGLIPISTGNFSQMQSYCAKCTDKNWLRMAELLYNSLSGNSARNGQISAVWNRQVHIASNADSVIERKIQSEDISVAIVNMQWCPWDWNIVNVENSVGRNIKILLKNTPTNWKTLNNISAGFIVKKHFTFCLYSLLSQASITDKVLYCLRSEGKRKLLGPKSSDSISEGLWLSLLSAVLVPFAWNLQLSK